MNEEIIEFVRKQNLLSNTTFAVFEALARNPHSTISELRAISQIRKTDARLADLKIQGMAKKVQKRKCSVTGKDCMTWEITGRRVPLPLHQQQKKTKSHLCINKYKDHNEIYNSPDEAISKARKGCVKTVLVKELKTLKVYDAI